MEIKQTNTPPPKLNRQFHKYRCDQVTFIKILPKHLMEQHREKPALPQKNTARNCPDRKAARRRAASSLRVVWLTLGFL